MLKILWAKAMKKMRGSAIRNSRIDKTARVGAGSNIIGVDLGRYTYCGYDCNISNCTIGNFSSLASNVNIGGGAHPIQWVSTSPAFYLGRDSISKRLASLTYDFSDPHTHIGNDVWIGAGVFIKSGITIGDGAVIGMGSVVTKDVAPYTIVVGNPAAKVRERFDDRIKEQLLRISWWDWDDKTLAKYSHMFDDPFVFCEKLSMSEE